MSLIQRPVRAAAGQSAVLLLLFHCACASSDGGTLHHARGDNPKLGDSGSAMLDEHHEGGQLPNAASQSPAGSSGLGDPPPLAASEAEFSFFVTSYSAMQRLSGSADGFGGDLRYGEADGLAGADKICREVAESALPGAGKKTWRAFLSATRGPDGMPVHAIERIGQGPWYDRLGRLVAATRADLMANRPLHGDPAIMNDLPNETGVPNHTPDGEQLDNHDILTGSSTTGQLYSSDWSATCHDWTSAVGSDGRPRVGHSWPRAPAGTLSVDAGAFARQFAHDLVQDYTSSWASALDEAGCGAGASLVEMGEPKLDNPTVGSGGGYGGIYCFVAR